MSRELQQILVVDDESFSRMIVARHLREIGEFDVVHGENGAAALVRLTSPLGDRIRCIIADFNMPVLNGLQLLKAVRTGIEGIRRDLPVILVTGHADKRLIGKAVELDVDAFIVKPLSKATLENKLGRVLKGERSVKPSDAYMGINVDENFLALPDEPETPPQPAAGPKPAPKDIVPAARADAVEVALEKVPDGAILAADIVLTNGTVLLGAGMTLMKPLIDKLLDLRALNEPLNTVWIKAGK